LANETFKLTLSKKNFDNLINEEIDNLIKYHFDLVLNDHIEFERKYDEETNHMNNKEMQLIWQRMIDNKLKIYL